ncbi:MAG: tetratricopeptide repeat protein, partial [Rhodanobacteraceae bacterium]|nr:tetratricopeptide repeat protein [Rhodanobacteraceae bacterium]
KLAAALHNLGAVLTRVGRYEEALPILVQARDIATAQTGPRSPLTVTLMVALAELQALRGEAATGLGLADTAIAIASADYAANKNLLGAAYRARAQAQRAAGHMAAARADVAQAGALFAQTGRSGAAYARQLEPLRAAVAEP